ncbi:hypothetical protein C1X59_05370 [Pseudomonas sp. FW215-R2]|uniref:NACHT domain-containing protein n=1 Tax=unclassified Pseudomonas TaxID=196821 RepID=UPI000C87F93A|nr:MULTISPECIES: hypothetical protein [unclassified Pseudomonas]PMX03064.1 hypothetical protein C1X59_05370 [Pseudomonas sp. FW215-R2]PMX11971.1 hypothetical protein C1X60_05290 [Pseudomonas sp. FW215-L1]PMX25641.1 hypothetical protein C1X57_04030 [Pseudomonas sp. FW215-E1]PNA32643.1 hypothetical protein C1X58_03510 [Pseudomonas sp. FW215-R4]
MTKHSDAFIDLDRTFSKIPLDADVSDDVDLSGRHSRQGELRWPDLITHHRVILLSEAGSGKTAEIRNVAYELRSQGKTSFFLRIENVTSDLEDAFEVGTFDEFESWLASDGEGWLLMDSVDEARLNDPKDFERAIRKLGRLTQNAVGQAHIIITGRSTAWRAKTDLAICEKAFAFRPVARQAPSTTSDGFEGVVQTVPCKKTEPVTSFLLVTLDDIHDEQIDRFLDATGVQDIKAFRAAVERKEAWSLTTRPLDFLELVDFWLEHHRIGSRLELMRSSINRRLEERDQDRAESRPIAPDRLREGARLIAAATTLGLTSAIRVPDGEINKSGIAIREVLTDWNDTESAALLNRPIFEPGIYGTVRFHHRTVREYLTAEWLHELIRGAGSRVKIENLFFRTQYGLEVINPSMRPVLPWLALLDDRICTRLEEVAPEVFFEGGDPGQLPLSTRRRVLRKACEHLAQPAHSWTMTDYSAVQRFAHHDLTEDIKELLTLYRTNDDIAWFLLRMVWQGEVVGALAETKQFALDAQHKHTRLAAIRAVIDLGTAQDIADVRLELLAGDSKVNREWLAELLDGLALDSQWLPWLLQAIERSAKKERYSGRDSLALKLSSLAMDCPLENLPALICGLGALLDKPPTEEHGFSVISKRYAWLAEIAGLAVLRLLQVQDPFALDESALAILSKLAQAHIYDERDTLELGEKLREIVPTWPELDYKLFWYDVRLARNGRVHREPVIHVWQLLGFRPFWSLNSQNFSLACEHIVCLTNMHDRQMSLSMAFNIYTQHSKPSSWETQLRQSVDAHDELREKLEILLNPPERKVEEWEIKQAQWTEEAAQRKAEEAEHRRSWQEGLAADVALINSPQPGVMTRSQSYLMERMREGSSSSNTWSSGHWQSLVTEFGLPVAQAFRIGAVNFWRGYCPALPSDGASANSTPYQVIFGLTGLAIESKEEPSRFSQMSVDEAEYAARYGMLELNGFPEWLPKLFGLYPRVIREVVMREINCEIDAPRLELGGNRVLQRLRWGGSWMYEELAAPLMLRLTQHISDLESNQLVLSIVQESSVADELLAELACKRAIEEVNLEVAPTWYAVWVGVEPVLAIPALVARIDSLSSDQEKTTFAMLCLIAIVGSRTASRCRQKYKTVENVKSLYLLMHTYIRIAEDIDRAGKGVYSPGLRDDAQNARDGLLAIIREAPGKESFLALQEIAQAHPAERLRPWSAFYAQQKATADSQTPPWEPSKIVEFHKSLESTPSTHRDLWNIAIDRLLDLKHDLEDSDSSYAEILLQTNHETSIRKFIGKWLRDHAAGRYVVPQEEQLADDKRPDYRFQNSDYYAPVPVELKLSQNWSGPGHFERLENQLCGDYLRDISSSCGIFLLVNHGGQATWETSTKGRVGFNDLVIALQEHWLAIASRFPNVEDIKIIGIDLTKRGGVAATKAIEANQAEVNQIDDE